MNHEFEKFKAYVKSELPQDLEQMMHDNDAVNAQGILCMINQMKKGGFADSFILYSVQDCLNSICKKSPEAALEFKIQYEKYINEKIQHNEFK